MAKPIVDEYGHVFKAREMKPAEAYGLDGFENWDTDEKVLIRDDFVGMVMYADKNGLYAMDEGFEWYVLEMRVFTQQLGALLLEGIPDTWNVAFLMDNGWTLCD